MKVGPMKPGEIQSEGKPEIIESPHVKRVLDILDKQLEILKLLSLPAVFIPDRDFDLK